MSDLLKAMSQRVTETKKRTEGRGQVGAWNYSRRLVEEGDVTIDLNLSGEGKAEEALSSPIQMAAHATKRKRKGKDKSAGESLNLDLNFYGALSDLPGNVPGETAYEDYVREQTERSAHERGEVAEAEKLERELTEAG